MIVVDTNVIAYLLIQGDKTTLAENLFRRDPEWAAPLLWRSEFMNVLTLTVRHRGMTRSHALCVMKQAERVVSGREFTVHPTDVLRLSMNSRSSAYDCEFVVLAEDLDVPLVTADRRILTEFPVIAKPLSL